MAAQRVILRIPNLHAKMPTHAVKGNVGSEPKIVVSDRTYILGDNVKYIEYDNLNKGRLLIHYNNYATEELYNHKDKNETRKIYNMIIDALKDNGTFIEYNEE